MVDQSESPQSIPSSPEMDGSKRRTWAWDRMFLARKDCVHCGKEMSPKIYPNGQPEAEHIWNKREFCSISCSKKHANPMSKNAARLKMRETLLRIKHAPISRGGNGRLLPLPQLALLHALGEGWHAEVAIPTRMARDSGYPTNYKLDIANPEMKWGIEIDGASHNGQRKELDQKKSDFLATLGWKVSRLTNEQAMNLYSTFTSLDTLLTSLKEF